MRGRFWRLLTAYESLTRDQEAALRHTNVILFNELQTRKAAIFGDLLAAAEGEHMTGQPAAQARVQALLELEKAHSETLSRWQAKARAERQHLLLAGHRLKAMRVFYATFSGRPRHAFSAHV